MAYPSSDQSIWPLRFRRPPRPILLLFAAFLARPGIAQGAEPDPELGGIELDWSAPPECPTKSQVLLDAQGLARSESAALHTERIPVQAAITAEADGPWLLILRVDNAERRVRGDSCAELGRAAALFLALLVEPLRGPSEPPSAPKAPAASPPAQGLVALRPVRLVPTEPDAEWKWRLDAGVWVETQTLPQTEIFPTVSVGVHHQPWVITLRAAIGSSQRLQQGGADRVEVRRVVGALSTCHRTALAPRLFVGPCLSMEAGVVQSELVAPLGPTQHNWTWLGGSAQLLVEPQLSKHFALALVGGPALPFWVPRLRIEGLGVLERPEPGWRLGILGVAEL